ncbi:MAG: 2-oxo acid dehydrogenase subunit E2 [Bacteroidales bacterium]
MKEKRFNNEWRKVASSIYRRPVDSKIFGSVELDVTDLEKYINSLRKKGIKVTLTHFFTLAVARALRDEVPELNCYIRRGNVIRRSSVDAMVSVLLNGSEMSSVRVNNADTLTLAESAAVINDQVRETRSGKENRTMRSKAFIAGIPWPLRGWIFNMIRRITLGWGISIPSLGLSANNFGSFVVSNIGSIGLDTGYPALFPTSNVSFVLILGGVSRKPVVVDDQIVPRRVLTLSTALDHRVVDAWHGGLLFRYLKRVVANPALLESSPPVIQEDRPLPQA